MNPYNYEHMRYAVKIRYLWKDKPELKNADVLIFHCPFDCALLDYLDKPSILYEHRAGRPNTFMFKIIMKEAYDPLHRYLMERDNKKVLRILKELFHKPDVVICNSKFIKNQLKKWFGRDAYVVYPPVDLKVFRPMERERKYFLSIQRINWQKRIDVQLKAFEGLKEKLLIVGPGYEDLMKYLTKDMPNVEYLGEVKEKELVELINGAKAVIQTGYFEDFGLVPVEAMACGIPSIVVDEGGFKETIHSSWLGVRIRPPYVKSLRKAVINFKMHKYDRKRLRNEAKKYGLGRFSREIKKYVKLAIKIHEERKLLHR